MTTQQQSEHTDQQLVGALETAVGVLNKMLRTSPPAREVRSVLYDISADAGVPLPVSLQVYVPQRTEAIIADNDLARIIFELNHLKEELSR